MDRASETTSHALWAATITLTLGILGSSVLPLPWAFSRLGVVPGLIISFTVALTHTYTGMLLLQAAGALHKRTYESVCAAAFHSPAARTLAQGAILLMLFGTLAGDAALLADTGSRAITKLSAGSSPKWLVGGDGRVVMVFLMGALVLPLSLSRKMRNLERAATAGVAVVMLLMLIIIKDSVAAQFPAIVSGEFPIFSIPKGRGGEIPEAVSVISYAFYLQPMLLPLLSEMPPGRRGLNIVSKALQVATLGVAVTVYGLLGVFAAARWGRDTQGDVLMNEPLQGDRAGGALDAAMAAYLSLSAAPIAITMRYLLDSVVAGGELGTFSAGRDMAFTIMSVSGATAVALVWPKQAEKLFAVTGATGVCLVSYVFPIAVHLRLYLTDAWRGRVSVEGSDGGPETWLLQDAARLEAAPPSGEDRRDSSVVESGEIPERNNISDALLEEAPSLAYPYPSIHDLREQGWLGAVMQVVWYLALPVVVLCLGLGMSFAGLAISVSRLRMGRL